MGTRGKTTYLLFLYLDEPDPHPRWCKDKVFSCFCAYLCWNSQGAGTGPLLAHFFDLSPSVLLSTVDSATPQKSFFVSHQSVSPSISSPVHANDCLSILRNNTMAVLRLLVCECVCCGRVRVTSEYQAQSGFLMNQHNTAALIPFSGPSPQCVGDRLLRAAYMPRPYGAKCRLQSRHRLDSRFHVK